MALKAVPIWVSSNHSLSQSDFVQNKKKFPNFRVHLAKLSKWECLGLKLAHPERSQIDVEDDEKPLTPSDLGSASADGTIEETQITESRGFHRDLNSLPRVDVSKIGDNSAKFVVIGRRGHRMNILQSADRRMKAFKENSILSFNKAAKHSLDYIEFDVQVTKDDVAIIFHDNFILHQEHGAIFEKRVTDLTLDEFFMYGPQREAGKKGKTLVRKVNGNIVGWDVESDDHSCTLQEAFEKVDPTLGFNVELKFDDDVDYEEDHLVHVLQVILKVVYEQAKDRPIIFSSFQPDAVLLMKKLQQRYPVYFLTNGGTELYDDVRRNSLEEAKKLAIGGGLDGIVSEVKGIFRNPSAVREIKESKLSLLTYGKLNNFPETVHVQHLMGVDGVIVDLVEEITRAVDEMNTRKSVGDVKGESGCGIELSFLLNLISQVIQH